MVTPILPIDSPHPSSTKAVQNRINSQSSTGPKSEDGKRRSSLNALRHGLFSQSVVLPWEDSAAFNTLELRCREMYLPVGQLEADAAEGLAELRWRLRRCGALEGAVISFGLSQSGGSLDSGDDQGVPFHVDADALQKLSISEQRLFKQFQVAEARYFRLQAERRARLKEEAFKLGHIRNLHREEHRPFHPAEFGFVSQAVDIAMLFRRDDAMLRDILPEFHAKE